MPLKPVHKLTGTPKSFEEFADGEKVSWIKETHASLIGIFGGPRAEEPRNVDAVNVRRCIEFFDALPEQVRSDGELVGAVDDLRELLTRLPAETERRKRA